LSIPLICLQKTIGLFCSTKGIASKVERAAIVKQVLEVTNLYEVRLKDVNGYSGGMKQRFGIAQYC
jgi:ABC-type multidrug transport system ATPase subunit